MEGYTLDIRRWISMFPLDSPPAGCRNGFKITGPCDLAHIEQIRTRASEVSDLGSTVPTDVFVFGHGEAGRRDVTKVGGLPYRPRQKPWPTREEGGPMTFLAQYRFTESRDIVGDLPGDILLLFAADERGLFWGHQSQLLFEWYPLGLTDLATKGELMQTDWEFVTCYGARHRTLDYVEKIGPRVLKTVIPEKVLDTFPIEFASLEVSRLVGMKIGGLPMLFYSPEERPDLHQLPGRFLCSLATTGPMPEQKYPWINRARPYTFGEGGSPQLHLEICDGFVLYVSIAESDKLHWAIQCY